MAAYNDLCSVNKRGFNFGKTGGTGCKKGTRKGTPLGTQTAEKARRRRRKGTQTAEKAHAKGEGQTAETSANNGVATHFYGGKRQK